MPSEAENSRDSDARLWKLHVLMYLLLCGLMVYILWARYFKPIAFGEAIGVEPARVQLVEQRIDPNIAPWPELARLPEVGESLAKRIVAYRQSQAGFATSGPFHRPADLLAVKGIGPKTLQSIEPFLKFPSSRPVD